MRGAPGAHLAAHHSLADHPLVAHLASSLQETGRAGRDGETSFSVLYSSHADTEWCNRVCKGHEKAKLGSMVDYALEPRCRRAQLLSYFGERNVSCTAGRDVPCDVCAGGRDVRKRQACAETHRERLVCPPLLSLSAFLCTSRSARLPAYSLPAGRLPASCSLEEFASLYCRCTVRN